MTLQLPLGITLRDGATFENFVPGRNDEVIAHLQQGLLQAPPQGIYCWGNGACGKTHLLQAVCHAATDGGRRAVYLPMAQIDQWQPAILEALEGLDVICVDDIQCLAGHRDWEEGLFHLYNRMLEQSVLFVAAGVAAPAALGLDLADLVSRLSWGWVFRLHGLSDSEKQQALIQRAGRRGLFMTNEVAAYLLRHSRRDLHALMALLGQLDIASLAEQRRLTLPFVREKILRTEDH